MTEFHVTNMSFLCKLYLDTADYDYQSNAYTGKMYFKVLHLPCGGGGEVTSPYYHMLTPNYICVCGWLKITWLMILYIYFRKCQNDETVKNLGPHSKIPILSEDRMIIVYCILTEIYCNTSSLNICFWDLIFWA